MQTALLACGWSVPGLYDFNYLRLIFARNILIPASGADVCLSSAYAVFIKLPHVIGHAAVFKIYAGAAVLFRVLHFPALVF